MPKKKKKKNGKLKTNGNVGGKADVHLSSDGSRNKSLLGHNAIFTPDSDGNATISVSPGVFNDYPGNNNTVGEQFFWIYDGTPPSIIISAENYFGESLSSGITTNDTIIKIILTSTEITTDFEFSDIVSTNGALSSFNGSGKTYLANLTSNTDGPSTVNVYVNSFCGMPRVVNSNCIVSPCL